MSNYKEVFQLAQDKGAGMVLDMEVVGKILDDSDEKETLALIQLTLIQKWLRDEHKIHVGIEFNQDKVNWQYQGVSTISKSPWFTAGDYQTYEQALLEGINEALNI